MNLKKHAKGKKLVTKDHITLSSDPKPPKEKKKKRWTLVQKTGLLVAHAYSHLCLPTSKTMPLNQL
jgi:hypothetical protein